MGRYVYCGSQGDETFCGYTYLECYKDADTGALVTISSSEEDMRFRRNNEIISWEEYRKIRDELEYGKVINHYLKFCLKNRNWKSTIESLGLDIESILEKCSLIENEKDCILTSSYGIFPSRIFEIVSLLENYLTGCQDKETLSKLGYIVNYLKAESENILIGLAKSDLSKAKCTKVLETLGKLKSYELGYLERTRVVLLNFDEKEKGIINSDVISDLQSSKLTNRILLSFYDYYDFNSLVRKSERNYPLYCGTNILECLAFESIQYPHYLKWQNKRLDTRIDGAVVSPWTNRLLNDINSDILCDLLDVVKKLEVSDLSLEQPSLDNSSRRLILNDSFVQFGSDNKLTFK